MVNQRPIPSRGNVFEDLGFPREEAAHLRVRSALMAALAELIQARGLNQRQAASLLGVSQPRVSDLVRGRLELFSSDMLIDLLSRAGVQVELSLSPLEKPLAVLGPQG